MRVLLLLLVAPAAAQWDGNLDTYGDCPLGQARYKTGKVGCCYQGRDYGPYEYNDVLWNSAPPWDGAQIGWMQSGNVGTFGGNGYGNDDEKCWVYHNWDKCFECVAGRFFGENTKFEPGYWERAGTRGNCNFCGLCCQQCEHGQYQNEEGQSSCKSCPAGQYQDMVIRKGTYYGDQPTSCKSCPAGTHIYCYTLSLSGLAIGFAADAGLDTCNGLVQRDHGRPCVACAAGKFADRRQDGNGICWHCWMRNMWAGPGTEQKGDPIANGGWGVLNQGHQSNCNMCPHGFVSNAAHTGCDACGSGMHAEYDYLLHSYYLLGLLSGQAAARGASASAYN